MFDVLGKLGGLSGLMGLASNPEKLPPLILQAMPSGGHTLGRMKLYQEIAWRAAVLSAQCHTLLSMSFKAKEDIPSEALAGLAKVEQELLQLAHNLNVYRKLYGTVTIDQLAAIYGLQGSHADPQQTARDQTHTPAGNGHAGSA